MSDSVIIAFIGSLSTTAGIVISAWINAKGNKKIVGSVETYHDEVNSKMTRLLDTTEKFGQVTGKLEAIEEKQPIIDQLNKDSQPKQ